MTKDVFEKRQLARALAASDQAMRTAVHKLNYGITVDQVYLRWRSASTAAQKRPKTAGDLDTTSDNLNREGISQIRLAQPSLLLI